MLLHAPKYQKNKNGKVKHIPHIGLVQECATSQKKNQLQTKHVFSTLGTLRYKSNLG